MPRRLTLAAIAATLAIALSGCGEPAPQHAPTPTASGPAVPLSELPLLDDPRAYEGPSTALLRSAGIDPITDSPEQSLPVTVTSHDLTGDREVTVTSTERLLGIDISGSIAATIIGLGFGDRLVGRDVSTTYEPYDQLPLATSSGHTVSGEALIALRPTLIITDGTVGPIDVLLQARDAGIPVVFTKTEKGLVGAIDLIHQVAAALGATPTGELLATSLRQQLDTTLAEIAAIAPEGEARVRMMFLYLRGGSGVYYLFGEESGASDLIVALGGVDVAAEIGWVGNRPMTDEAMISANPDLILVMTDGLASVGGVEGLLEAKPAIALTNAGKHHRFVDMADGQILSFGPRIPDVLDALARAVYAPEPC